MAMLLHPMAETQSGGKWTDEEIFILQSCVHRFAGDLSKLSQHINTRTDSQIRTSLRKKAFEGAGIPVSSNGSGVKRQSTKVTLNMLNALENEVDIEGFTGDVMTTLVLILNGRELFLSGIFRSVFK